MSNPKYKFFQSELEDWEISRYNDGSEVRPHFSTPEVEQGINRIRKELEARGYQLMKGGCGSSLSFSKPEYCMAAYLGTFVNRFSLKDPIPLWSNEFAHSYKFICVSEVYRHNGTSSNVSLRLSVCKMDSKVQPRYYKDEDGHEWCGGGSRMIEGEEIRKFKPSVSDKVLTRILDKADEVIEATVVTDPSIWEKDAKDFHPSTEKEIRINQLKKMKKGK